MHAKVVTGITGYARYVRCAKQHGGNRQFAHHTMDVWQCQGCGNCVSSEELAIAQQSATPNNFKYV